MKQCTLFTIWLFAISTACAADGVSPVYSAATGKANPIGLPIYYFSSSTGNDARSSLEAQTPLTPWKTLAKLNAVLATAQPGTTFLLKRGDVFDGSIQITASGNALSSILISAYGLGNKPIVNGFASLNSWTDIGNNIWQSPLQAGARLNMLTVNGTVKMRGRWPNGDAANGGYVIYQSHNGFTSITTNNFGNQNWYNAGTYGTEISIRSVRWMLNTYKLMGQSSGTFTYDGRPDEMQVEPSNGNGYFIQNDPRTLDQQNEWYYNPATRAVQLYSTVNPAGLEVKAAVVDTLVKGTRVKYITLNNISFQGSNQQTIYFFESTNITVSDCNINYAGLNAVKFSVTPYVSFTNNTVDNTSNRAVDITPYCFNSIVRNNAVDSTGLINGLGGNGNLSNLAIFFHGDNSVCINNKVTNTGYNAIVFTGSNVEIKYNLVDSFCVKFDDGGGIYTSGDGSNKNITGNVVLHGLGNVEGTTTSPFDRLSEGIYLDERSENMIIDSNQVAYCADKGLYLHNVRNVTVTNNTFFANINQGVSMMHDGLQPDFHIRGVTIKNNVLFSTSSLSARTGNNNLNYTNSLMTLETNSQDFADLTAFGTADSNYYIKPFYLNRNDFYKFSYRPIPAGASVGPTQDDSNAYRKYLTMDFVRWQNTFRQDAHSITGLAIPPYTVNSQDVNTFTNGTFDANIQYVLNPNSSSVTQSWDNTHLDNGALQVAYTPVTGDAGKSMEAWFVDVDHAKTLAAGHTFRAKFSILGNADHNIDLRCALRSATASTIESNWLFFKVDNKRQEVELLFTASADIPKAYLVMVNDNADSCSMWWIDNIVVQEVAVSYTNPLDYLRFEYNASNLSKPVILDGIYTDLKNNIYPSLVVLPPYTSIILIKKDLISYITQSSTSSAGLISSEAAVPENDHHNKLRLIPNPAVNHIRLSLPATGMVKQATIIIYNAQGSVVKAQQATVSNQPFEVSITSFKPGVYTVRIVYARQSFTERFIKL
ncbi:MAG: right-handed parallel beta-helix repeat-containing protein [Williamsia sp.]|nr:right-handed parallel beta-helix repeat-containing protein [Williamsia sp.]